jgi:uncharacterized protein
LSRPVGAGGSVPAAYIRALDLTVERHEQRHLRLPDEASHQRYN